MVVIDFKSTMPESNKVIGSIIESHSHKKMPCTSTLIMISNQIWIVINLTKI